MKKLFAIVLLFVAALALVACGNNEKKEVKQEVTVAFAGDPETIDPALNSTVDGAVICTNAFEGLYGYKADAKGNPELIATCAEAVVKPTANGDGTYRYVLKLREGLKWSNGTELKASDFVYAWNRAADPNTGADYGFLYEVFVGYDAMCEERETNTEGALVAKLAATADDAARTITFDTAYYCAYFDQLLAFPTFYPVCKAVVEADPQWATKAETYVSNGAFKMKSWTVGSEIVFVKNENYYNAAATKLEKLTFFLSEDDDAVFANFTAGEIAYTTHVPVDQIPVLKNDKNRMGKDFFIGDYIGTWYIEFSVNYSFKAGLANAADTAEAWEGWDEAKNAEVRHALALLIDRNYIVNSVTAGGQLPAYGFVPAGMSDGNGNTFRDEAEEWWSVDPADYDDNKAEAVNILKKYYNYDEATGKFTNFPKFDLKLNQTTGNVAILTACQNMWHAYGIECEFDQRAWTILTAEVSAGNFTVSRMGWIADYNDPVNFLEIYLTNSGNNHPQAGRSGIMKDAAVFGPDGDKAWAEYDKIIAAIKSETDMAKRAQLMYEAEEWLAKEAFICPVYYYTNPYLCKTNFKDFLYSPLGWVSFKTAYVAE